MNTRSSSASYGVRSFATLLICRYRVSSTSTNGAPGYHHISSGMMPSKFGNGIGSAMRLSISNGNYSIKRLESKTTQEDTLAVQPSDPAPPRPNIFSWVKWVLGSILPLFFSFCKQKWDSMLKLEDKVEEVVKEAEEVVDMVEKVASMTENLSADVAEKLDDGEMKEVARMVEHASSVIAKDARASEDFIHKVGDLKKDLETIVEPVIDKIEHKK